MKVIQPRGICRTGLAALLAAGPIGAGARPVSAGAGPISQRAGPVVMAVPGQPVRAAVTAGDTPAGRTPAAAVAKPPDPAEFAARVARRLGSRRTAGPYIDRHGRPVVTVTDTRDTGRVRSLGAIPKRVQRSRATLAKIKTRLRPLVRMSGTSWAVDPVAARLDVEADSTVTGTRLAVLRKALSRYGPATRLRRIPGRLALRVAGGEAIRGVSSRYTARCSLGFNVRRGSNHYFLTAGHCTDYAGTWYLSNSARLGVRSGSSYPGNDYGIVRHTNSGVRRDGIVRLYNGGYRDITGIGTPVVGAIVESTGSTTGRRRGRITAVNTVVHYGNKRLTGMIRTNLCAEPGDSGGPLFRGTAALGLMSGGWGNCTTGGESWYQPVIEPVRRYSVTLY